MSAQEYTYAFAAGAGNRQEVRSEVSTQLRHSISEDAVSLDLFEQIQIQLVMQIVSSS